MTKPNQKREQHDNPPAFDVGKAYRLNDGSKRRLLILGVETKRVKTDEHEFNGHRYKAVIVEDGGKLSINESPLAESVSSKPCKVAQAEIAKYTEPSEAAASEITSKGASEVASPPAAVSGAAATAKNTCTACGWPYIAHSQTEGCPPAMPLPPPTYAQEPRTGVIVQDGMGWYQIGKLVGLALLDNHTGIVVSAPGVQKLGGREVKRG
jgi:hypothetical protein